MWYKFIVFNLAVTILGCAAHSGSIQGRPTPVPAQEVNVHEKVAPLQESKHPKLGLIFGKTDFKGLLKASFVRLTITPVNDPSKRILFYVGTVENQSVVPWEKGRVIEPGYFYFQLPPGQYEISSLAIPVGSSLAEEALGLRFEVMPRNIIYIGTLDVTGTKEKMKFGGVPIVKPGFDYVVNVKDDFETAKKDIEKLIPRHRSPVVKKLLETTNSL